MRLEARSWCDLRGSLTSLQCARATATRGHGTPARGPFAAALGGGCELRGLSLAYVGSDPGLCTGTCQCDCSGTIMADDDRASHGSRHSGSGQLDGALPLLQVTGAGAGEVNGQYDCVQLDLGRLGTVQRNAVYRKKDDPDIMIVLFR